MKKIGLVFKEVSSNRIKNAIEGSESFFVIKYSGLSSPDLSSLRQALKAESASCFVVRNKVAQKTLKDKSLDSLIKLIEGPCGLVFIKDEPVSVSKLLCNFAKDHEKLILEGGYLKDKIIEKKDILAMAKLPGKDALRAQVVMTLNSPIVKLVMVLNGNLRKLVSCLDQIKKKKQ
ncbi:MAG: 50S ribosomal protein L10 [Candidatus Omnitrophota bacterium]|nr:50S ribosomal protein L10 [Candidatus Omnitrophota bacterium]MBU1928729.1 50S ribosomal protein L10 [Candidatus Omnitrophota bacterium]MBU2034184.1 50S ribosomal protein L10 [Candidatus Omnitrophota bacterium]MBU2221048.1 50S ribosomal protein L10 [Candidatus Omnitrophota bacterium]MBU2258466.1 50S ribosomal protein L10 [Candidatus Omnitrophota bacterium]